LTLGLLTGCVPGSTAPLGEVLTCDYLIGADNCWNKTASAATSCLPTTLEGGTLSADGKSCTYASGEVVTFTQPVFLPFDAFGTSTWNFTVTTASGASCLAFEDDGNGNLTLTVEGKTVKVTRPGGIGFGLSCPDGTTYSNRDELNVSSCLSDGGYPGLPGDSWAGDTTGPDFTLEGAGSPEFGEPVFRCQTAL
jgi:hypothetical protein